ncbi:hypothetical protein VPH35_109016 [Triticum aestivum]|uniref:Uncharacterized protein n=1 Tax=Triticum turgidum subsp. durum TaxID=4567 RepID=A0A9R0YF22_TRITD|nr:unnamed protein product [Triticum turgidum subsp. durum]
MMHGGHWLTTVVLANHSRVGIDLLCCLKTALPLVLRVKRCDEPLKFWEESDPKDNLLSCTNMMNFREFVGDPGEVGFLEFFEIGRAPETASVSMANPWKQGKEILANGCPWQCRFFLPSHHFLKISWYHAASGGQNKSGIPACIHSAKNLN